MSDPILSAVLGLVVFLLVGQLALLTGIFFRLGSQQGWIEMLQKSVDEIFNRLRQVELDLAELIKGRN